MGVAPRTPVNAPQAAAPRVGLIATARVLQGDTVDAPGRWTGGFSYLPEACAAGGTLDPCNPGSMSVAAGNTPDNVDYDPVVLWEGDTCSAMDLPRDYQGRARRLLVACQSKQLAAELWKGTQAQAMTDAPNRWLASDEANTVTNGALSEVNALACLEDALAACSCGRAMIHATPGTVTQWRSHGLIERLPASGGVVYVTAMDTLVIGDAGYDGSGPDGQSAASGSVWAYGTDLVDVRLGDIRILPDGDIRQAVNRSTNDITYWAERYAAATWGGCCHVAVEVDVDICADLAGS
jgi:hypothetical protein